MDTVWLIVIIVVAVIVVALLAMTAQQTTRRRRLQERFGPEYDRAVQKGESRREAERDLAAREQRHEDLQIRALPPATRDRYARDWNAVQERFVDSPGQAVGEADRLVILLMGERGYPTEGYEQQTRDLSVDHARTLEHYRTAHEINSRVGVGNTSTEELRSAMVHYRALFDELLRDETDSSPDTGRRQP
ncbi:hypothetical protein ACFWU3_08815 [Streptomyces sp. NPDC058685]|uniref:hypothetical protein n=1 Tax=Streptomyces sp. NPDC058685 TaxID=3346598 RepID=UPI0036660314